MTVRAQTALHDNGVDLLPAGLALGVGSDTEEPIALLVTQTKRDGLAADVPVKEIAVEVRGEAPAGRLVLVGIFKADGFRVEHLEVGGAEATEGGRDEERAHRCGGGSGGQ